MHIPKRQREWFMGRLTAKRLLTAPGLPLHDTPLYQIEIDNQPEGAPYIAAPPTPGSLSISHREALAAAAFTKAPNCNVGIDLEVIEPRAWSFVEDFFTENEANHARSLPKPLVDIWVTLAWSAKEAVLKVWQKGLRLDTRRVEILTVDTEQLGANPQDWQTINWQANIEGFQGCWLRWRQYGEYVITLAGEIKTGDPIQEPPDIVQIKF